MSYCKETGKDGKDKVIFVTKEDHEKPTTAQVEEYDDEEPGLILEDGTINWNCPCLGGMATGPCGFEFREAFSCFHNSKEDPKGSDCYDQFRSMQDCMINYPSLYESAAGDEDDDDDQVDVFAANAEESSRSEEESSRSESSRSNEEGSKSQESGEKASSSASTQKSSDVKITSSDHSTAVEVKKS